MNIKEWLIEMNKDNFPSDKRQKELAWESWICATNLLDGKNRYLERVLDKLSDDIKEDYDISMINNYQKENYGGSLTTYKFRSKLRRNLDLTKQDMTMMYRYNIYENGVHLVAIEEVEDLITWLNNNL